MMTMEQQMRLLVCLNAGFEAGSRLVNILDLRQRERKNGIIAGPDVFYSHPFTLVSQPHNRKFREMEKETFLSGANATVGMADYWANVSVKKIGENEVELRWEPNRGQ
jgi:hypothetical protein